jgi:putative ATP-binding cassette transporter
MAVIGRRFIKVSENKNQAEAEYRYVLTRVRENGESIGLLQGAAEERNGVDKSLKTVLHGWWDICIQNMRTTSPAHYSFSAHPPSPLRHPRSPPTASERGYMGHRRRDNPTATIRHKSILHLE